MPEYLPERAAGDGALMPVPPVREPFSDGDYSGMLAAGYLLAIPGAAMTAGLGMLLPVGMHYHHGNPAGGVRALLGILGGLSAGGLVGGLADQPRGSFELTTGMIVGALSGFFAFGVIDVLFFSHIEQPQVLGLSVDVEWRPRDGGGLRVSGRL